jgi:hypothetical protein
MHGAAKGASGANIHIAVRREPLCGTCERNNGKEGVINAADVRTINASRPCCNVP